MPRVLSRDHPLYRNGFRLIEKPAAWSRTRAEAPRPTPDRIATIDQLEVLMAFAKPERPGLTPFPPLVSDQAGHPKGRVNGALRHLIAKGVIDASILWVRWPDTGSEKERLTMADQLKCRRDE